MNQEKNTIDQAVDKLQKELSLADKAFKGSTVSLLIKRSLAPSVAGMLMKFCYQNEEFAQAVGRCEKTVIDLINELSKKVTRDNPSLSDVEAYAAAVKFYLPAAQVTVSFRILLPEERDDDLIFLNMEAEQTTDDGSSAEQEALILDLFNTDEEV